MALLQLQSENHLQQILSALQTTENCNIRLFGSDSESALSERLWILSPFIRSILGSVRNIQENILILPDFSSGDINSALDILEGENDEDLLFNDTEKRILETLGVGLNCSRYLQKNDLDKSKIRLYREPKIKHYC